MEYKDLVYLSAETGDEFALLRGGYINGQETEKGFFCFIGIDLHPETRRATLSVPIDDWDIYASCYVLDDGSVTMDECRLPEEAGT